MSLRALAIYLYLLSSRKTISADIIAKTFTEGRRATLTALKELRALGLINTKRYRIRGRYATISTLVEPPFQPPETALLLQQCKPNSQLANNPYSLITNCISSFANSRTEVREKEETNNNNSNLEYQI